MIPMQSTTNFNLECVPRVAGMILRLHQPGANLVRVPRVAGKIPSLSSGLTTSRACSPRCGDDPSIDTYDKPLM